LLGGAIRPAIVLLGGAIRAAIVLFGGAIRPAIVLRISFNTTVSSIPELLLIAMTTGIKIQTKDAQKLHHILM
jgi:hypothetical protein